MAKKSNQPSIKEMLKMARDAANAKMGKVGIISSAASDALCDDTGWVSTGSLSLDRLIRGCNPGGIPIGPNTGRIVHIAGEWSSGKSLILDHIFKNVQDMGGICYVAEAEATREKHFADLIGLDLDAVEMTRGMPSMEAMFDHFFYWHERFRKLDSTTPILFGIDSLDSVEATKSSDKGLSEGKAYMYGGGKSEVLGVALKRLTNRVCGMYPTSVVLLNQVREKVNNVGYGDSTYTPGGNPPHFYSSVEIKIKSSPLGAVRAKYKGAKLTGAQRQELGFTKTERGDIVARWIRATLTKTKVSSTYFQFADFYLDFERGVSRGKGLLSRLLAEGLVKMDGKYVIEHAGEFFDGGSLAKSERLWGNWLAQNMEVLSQFGNETERVPNDGENEIEDDDEEFPDESEEE